MTTSIMSAKTIKRFLASNIVPILFLALSAAAIPMSGYSMPYLVQEIVTRLARNSFLVLSLLLPIMAGMGLNFGMVLGAMAGQVALIMITDWNISGMAGLSAAVLLALPIAILLGILCGYILNKAKGREMVTSMILGFFINGIYQMVVLYAMGPIIPIKRVDLVLSRGYGIRNAVSLDGIRQIIDNTLMLKVGGIKIPVLTLMVIGLLCVFIIWFRRTKLGQDMRAVGQNMAVAAAVGIPVERTRIVAIVISTVLACIGQIIFLQNIGTLNTYNSHDQAAMFAVASLLIGGATVSKASIVNVFAGVILFHLMFVVSPMAGQEMFGKAQLGEYFRVFISYGIIALTLVLHAWRRQREKDTERIRVREAHNASVE